MKVLSLFFVCLPLWSEAAFVPSSPAASKTASRSGDLNMYDPRERGFGAEFSNPGGRVDIRDGYAGGGLSRPDRQRQYEEDYALERGLNPNNSIVQGDSRRTWNTDFGEEMYLNLETEGRPLDTNVELWQGPNRVAHKMRVWSEDGRLRPFNAVVQAPRGGYGSTVDVQNRGSMEFPVSAGVVPFRDGMGPGGPGGPGASFAPPASGQTIQGGSLKYFPLVGSMTSARVSLWSDYGTEVRALVELLEGPGTVRQLAEVYNERGEPFSGIMQLPGYSGTILIRNTGPIEFPIKASVEPAF